MTQESGVYTKEIPYYISYIMFCKKEYESIENYVSKFIDDDSIFNYEELLLINAKSFFELKDYEKSIYFFEKYKYIKPEFSVVQFYELGYSYYELGDYNNAIRNFNKIINSNNDVSPYGYYYLANSYLAVNQKVEAANAFKSSFDGLKLIEDSYNDHSSGQLAESAYYNFALLCYDLENSLHNPIDVFNDFIKQYPDSDKLSEIYSYLSVLYLRTSDYDSAISVLEKTIQDEGVKEKIQSIAYNRGVQLFSDQDYDSAIMCFNKSISNSVSSELEINAMFWCAEAFFLQKDYRHSINILNDLLLLEPQENIKNVTLNTLSFSYNHLRN